VMVGFPMVIFESLLAAWSFRLKPEMEVLSPLARYVVFFSGLYLIVKVIDLLVRGSYTLLADGSVQSISFLAEMVLGVTIPFLMLLSSRVRRSPRLLFTAATLVILGVVWNRINVFLVAYQPPYAAAAYFPSVYEVLVTIGLVAMLVLVYRLAVIYLPILSHRPVTSRQP